MVLRMPDHPESVDESSSSLAGLDIDLALSFVPAWAKEENVRARAARLAETEEDESRGPRPERPARAEREVGRERRGPRPPREGGGRERGGRPERRGAGDRPGRRPRPEGGRGEERRAAPAPVAPVLQGWSLEIQSDPRGVEGMARQLKAGTKAYPLFNLAALVLEKPERFRVSFKRVAEQADSLFQVRVDNSVWLSERDAVAHALARHRDRYYRTETVAVEPPKGAFSFIAVCGMSGTVLGPPNFHDYTAKLMRLHAERFAHVPFEVFKGRVRMVKDEALLEQWKQEQSVREVYIPLERPARPAAAASPAEVVAPATAAENPPAAVVAGAEVTPMPEDAPSAAESAPAPAAKADLVVESASTPESAPAAGESAGAAPTESAVRLESRAALEAHFREHHARRVIMQVRDKTTVPGKVALEISAGPIAARVRRHWEQLRRFPLPLAQRLGQQFVSRGLHLFKAHGRVTYVTPARPRYLDTEATPVDDGIKSILDYLQNHPKAERADQWMALVALRAHLPEAEREPALAKDLLWLLREGHVIDFAGGRLEAARKPRPAPVAAAESTGAEAAAAEAEQHPALEEGQESGEVSATSAEVAEEPALPESPAPVNEIEEVDAAGEPVDGASSEPRS